MLSSQQDDVPGSGRSDRVSSIERLLHRRRGWAWTAVGSLAACVVYFIIGVRFFGGLTGALAVITVVVLFALLLLVIVGLIAVVVDTVRLHRADAAVRRSALDSVSHHPVHAHAYRYPPRHRGSWVFAWLMLALWLLLAVVFLPSLVNSVGYLAGAGPKVTFVPVTHQVECSRGGCSTVTNGYLEPGGTQTTWTHDVPLGKSFSVRAPVWAWGIGRNLTDGTGTAIGMLIVSLFFEGIAVLIFVGAIVLGKNAAALHRRQAAAHVAG